MAYQAFWIVSIWRILQSIWPIPNLIIAQGSLSLKLHVVLAFRRRHLFTRVRAEEREARGSRTSHTKHRDLAPYIRIQLMKFYKDS